MKSFTIVGKVSKFPGEGGWFYVALPKKYIKNLKEKKCAWGMFPIKAKVGKTSWKTKLMMKKGGDFFVALKADIRKQEKIMKGDRVKVMIEVL